MLENTLLAKLGKFEIDLLHRRIQADGHQEVVLTHGEFSLLVGLLEHRGQAVPRNVLLDCLHHGKEKTAGDLRSVDTLIVRLRRKLENDSNPQPLIQTVYGKGYRLKEEHEL